MLYSDHIWRYQGLSWIICGTFCPETKKIVAGYTCTFQGPGQYVDFIVIKCFGPIKCYVWGKIGGL
jgi:hypothetical protein